MEARSIDAAVKEELHRRAAAHHRQSDLAVLGRELAQDLDQQRVVTGCERQHFGSAGEQTPQTMLDGAGLASEVRV